MRLHEYQAKRILSRYGVPVPAGHIATSVAEVRRVAAHLGKRVVLKAQVLTGGRGRAGGVRLAKDAVEAEQLAREMFGMDIHGYRASKVLVDEAIEVQRQVYLGITLDRATAQPVIVASGEGGVEIAEVDREMPERVYRIQVDPLLGLRKYQIHELVYGIGLGREHSRFISVALGLYQAFNDCDATLVEANPLVVGPNGSLVTLNARMVIDDNALFRHHDLLDMRDESQDTAPEQLARRHGISYVRLGGHVGCLFNGAGLAMATVDLMRSCGVRPANFVDLGEVAGVEKVVVGLRLALSNSVHALLVNLFCSVTHCTELAQGILKAWEDLDVRVPLVVRLEGANMRAGRDLLLSASNAGQGGHIDVVDSTREAVERVVALVQGESVGSSDR